MPISSDKRFFIETQKDNPTLIFPKDLKPGEIEVVLKQCYHRSINRKTGNLFFDLRSVAWCDIFSISLIALWIYALAKEGKKITFIYPRSPAVHKLFIQYGLEEFLNQSSITIEKDRLDDSLFAQRCGRIYAPYYPLTFFSHQEFTNLLMDLYQGNRLEIVLGGLADSEIVKTGAIRDIIIRELGQNIFQHTDGSNAHIIMTKLSCIYAKPNFDLAPDGTKRKKTMPIEQKFISRQMEQPVLEIVIGDKGEGIFSTLKKAYIEDETLTDKNGDPTECDILEYAFKYHSSRRSLEERIKEIKECISSDNKIFTPPTGLYRLKELIREYHGLLYVRSGASIICYNFFDTQKQDSPLRSDMIPGWKALANFGGTQYRIIVPLQKPRDKTTREYYDFFVARELEVIDNYDYLPMADYFPIESAGNLFTEAESLHLFCSEVNRISSRYQGKRIVIFVDFTLPYEISLKVLHYLVCELIQRQSVLQTFVAIGFNPQNARYFQNICLNSPYSTLRPLLAFDDNYHPFLVGIDSETAKIFEEISLRSSAYTQVEKEFAEQNKQLFRYDQESDRYVLALSQTKAFRAVRGGIEGRLKKILLDPQCGIFDQNIKVLLLSQVYCQGYFEIYKIFTNQKWLTYLTRWLTTSLLEFKPDIIVSIGKEAGIVMQETLSHSIALRQKQVKHINLHTKRQGIAELVGLLGLEKGKKVILFADVIGTSKTLKSVLALMPQTKVQCILAIVDARSENNNTMELKGNNIPVEKILSKSLTYFNRLPNDWSYTEIHQVDPATHTLVREMAKAEGALWKPVSFRSKDDDSQNEGDHLVNTFLEDVIFPVKAFFEGHFTSGEKHLTFLFDISKISNNFSEEIVSAIEQDIRRYDDRLQGTEQRKVTHLLYPDFNPGIDLIANKIGARFAGCIVMKITKQEFASHLDQENPIPKINAAIVLDDATESGETISRLVDIAERKGAKRVYGYVLIKRGNEYIARRMERLRQYGKADVHIRYMADVQVPSYTSQSCPLCSRKKRLEWLCQHYFSPEPKRLKQFLEDRISEIHPQPVSSIVGAPSLTYLNQEGAASTSAIYYRWLLETAKTYPGARHELAKVVSNHHSDPEACLTFFKIMTREGITNIFGQTFPQSIFYQTFTDRIVEACQFFMARIEELNRSDLEAILCISEYFQDYLILDQYFDVLLRVSKSEESFLQVLTHALLSQKFRDYPGIVVNALQRSKEHFTGNYDFQKIIDQVCRYWVKHQEPLHQRLASFKELRGGVFHEIGHLRSNLLTMLSNTPLDKDHLVRSWDVFKSDILRIIPLVRNVIAANVSTSLCNKLGQMITNIDSLFNQLNKAFNFMINSEAVKEPDSMTDSFVKGIELIYDAICGDSGLQTMLSHFESSIKKVCYDIINQHMPDIRERGMEVKRSFPEELCLVFGEEEYLSLVFHNLIENAWKWSEAKTFEIIGIRNMAKERLEIYFADAGKGLNQPCKQGEGLKKVQEIVSWYCGDFEILSSDQKPSFIDAQYNTVLLVSFPFLSSQEESRV